MSTVNETRVDPDIDAPEFFTTKRILTGIAIGGLMVGLLGSLPWIFFYLTQDCWVRYTEAASYWGGSYSFIGSIVSAMAFAGVIVTIMMQRHELRLQHRELQLTRDEMAATRKQHARTATAQEASDNKMLLAAYMNALESLRQMTEWRMNAKRDNYSPLLADSLTRQMRIRNSLEGIIKELEPTIQMLYPNLVIEAPIHSMQWVIEKLNALLVEFESALSSIGDETETQHFHETINRMNGFLGDMIPLTAYVGVEENAVREIDYPAINQRVDSTTGNASKIAKGQTLAAYGRIRDTLVSYIVRKSL